MKLITAIACVAAVLASVDASLVLEDDFDWDSIPPSRDLAYHKCYEGFKCARLEVPLDWLDESDNRTAVIAIRTFPARVDDDSPLFGGSILSNPGGPGGSGVDFIGTAGQKLRKYIDIPGEKHYEMVSFDPRGIGRTTPSSDCFHHDVLSRDSWILEVRGNGPLAASRRAVTYGLGLVGALSKQCKQTEELWGDAMAYVNTPTVARDMVAIVDKIDELRKHGAAERRKQRGAQDEMPGHGELRRRSEDDEDDVPRLQYIGFSYGTILGNYFASLFPGRVGRMVLDGVADSDDYANGPGWLTSTADTDKIFAEFWKGCYEAGPSMCALASGSFGDSAAEAQDYFWSWIDRLEDKPQATTTSDGSVVVITSQDVLYVAGIVLYSPLPGFTTLAVILRQAMEGHLELVANIVRALHVVPPLQEACPAGNISAPDPDRLEQLSAVVCGDGDVVTDKDTAWWVDYAEKQASSSRVLGQFWVSVRFLCASWPFRPNWSFKGPFTSPEPDPSIKAGAPAAPLLVLNNALDPVTPLASARRLAANHPGARLVVQKSMGHCATASAPSICTQKIVARYFATGEAPGEKETHCDELCGPWDEGCPSWAADLDVHSMNFAADRDEPLVLRRLPLGVM